MEGEEKPDPAGLTSEGMEFGEIRSLNLKEIASTFKSRVK
jgi:hypothetical protein